MEVNSQFNNGMYLTFFNTFSIHQMFDLRLSGINFV